MGRWQRVAWALSTSCTHHVEAWGASQGRQGGEHMPAGIALLSRSMLALSTQEESRAQHKQQHTRTHTPWTHLDEASWEEAEVGSDHVGPGDEGSKQGAHTIVVVDHLRKRGGDHRARVGACVKSVNKEWGGRGSRWVGVRGLQQNCAVYGY